MSEDHFMRTIHSSQNAFTLLEVLLVVAALGILAGIVIVALNPGKQLADTHNAKRQSDVKTIVNAVYQYSIDNLGNFPGSIPLTSVGLVGHWKLDETSGITANDSSGLGNNGTLTNGPVWTTGKIGQALEFDGVDDEVRVLDANSLDFSTNIDFSFSIWFKQIGADGEINFFNKQGVTSGWDFDYRRTNTDVRLVLKGGVGLFCTIRLTGQTFDDKAWHHFAGVVYRRASCTTDDILIYKDGLKQSPIVASSDVNTDANQDNTIDLTIGEVGAAGLSNVLDEARIYNRALSADEVLSLYGRCSLPLFEICKTGGDCDIPNTESKNFINLSGLTSSGVYITSIPMDPTKSSENGAGYYVGKDSNGRITVCAPHAESDRIITVTL